jgi:transcriptional regulator with XRE-family HTH domain
MLDLDQIKERLVCYNIEALSEQTGVHRNTLAAIKKGKNVNPTYKTLKALSSYLVGFK